MSSSISKLDLTQVPSLNSLYRLQFEKAQDSWVLLYPEGMIKLNPPAAEILKRCDGERTVNDIVSDIETTLKAEGITDDVVAFLDIALEQRWVTLDA